MGLEQRRKTNGYIHHGGDGLRPTAFARLNFVRSFTASLAAAERAAGWRYFAVRQTD